MKIEYDPTRDLLYVWFAPVGTRSVETVTVSPGVHADFDHSHKLIGLEVLDATEILGGKVAFEVAIPSAEPAKVA